MLIKSIRSITKRLTKCSKIKRVIGSGVEGTQKRKQRERRLLKSS